MTLDLTNDEALVLFDLLFYYGSKDDGRAQQAALEKQLVAPFEADYTERLAAARARMEEESGFDVRRRAAGFPS